MNTKTNGCIGRCGNKENCGCNGDCECAKENYGRQFIDVTIEEWLFLWLLSGIYFAGIYSAVFPFLP